MADETTSDRVLTVPNVISTARILLVPVFVWATIVERSPYAINTLLVLIGVSDFLDGWIARRFRQVTELGKMLDPIGDRIAVGSALLLFLYKGWMPLWLGGLLIAREAAVSVGVIVLGALGVPRIDVTFTGKLATLLLMFAVPFFTVAASDYSWHSVAKVLAYCLATPGLAVSYVAAGQYVRTVRRIWPERRVMSAA